MNNSSVLRYCPFSISYILSDKDTLHKISPASLWKTRSNHPESIRRKPVLTIIELLKKTT